MSRFTILEPEPLLRAVSTILSFGSPLSLVICMSKVTFYNSILDDMKSSDDISPLLPTLKNIESSLKVKVYFCETCPVLYGRLATLDDHSRSLVLLNPLALHSSLSAHSAQALNRTIAAAVDAALKLDSHLYLLESINSRPLTKVKDDSDGVETVRAKELQHESDQATIQQPKGDPWDQHLPILSATASRFGTERGWVGRTITARQVASRWCTIESDDPTSQFD